MSLYRQAGGSRARLIAVAASTLVVGAIAGYLIGRASASDPTLAELVAEARADVKPALSSLELVEIEYPQGQAAPSERDAAAEHAAAAAGALDDGGGLSLIDPDGIETARTSIAEVQAAIEDEAAPAEVRRRVAHARADVEALLAEEG